MLESPFLFFSASRRDCQGSRRMDEGEAYMGVIHLDRYYLEHQRHSKGNGTVLLLFPLSMNGRKKISDPDVPPECKQGIPPTPSNTAKLRSNPNDQQC